MNRRMKKSEMVQKECPLHSAGHRCCQPCKGESCIFYVDETKYYDTEDWGSCVFWKES